MIYDGFKASLAAGVPKEKAGILVDEPFGSDILRDAARNGYSIAYTVEKSGQESISSTGTTSPGTLRRSTRPLKVLVP